MRWSWRGCGTLVIGRDVVRVQRVRCAVRGARQAPGEAVWRRGGVTRLPCRRVRQRPGRPKASLVQGSSSSAAPLSSRTSARAVPVAPATKVRVLCIARSPYRYAKPAVCPMGTLEPWIFAVISWRFPMVYWWKNRVENALKIPTGRVPGHGSTWRGEFPDRPVCGKLLSPGECMLSELRKCVFAATRGVVAGAWRPRRSNAPRRVRRG